MCAEVLNHEVIDEVLANELCEPPPPHFLYSAFLLTVSVLNIDQGPICTEVLKGLDVLLVGWPTDKVALYLCLCYDKGGYYAGYYPFIV